MWKNTELFQQKLVMCPSVYLPNNTDMEKTRLRGHIESSALVMTGKLLSSQRDDTW